MDVFLPKGKSQNLNYHINEIVKQSFFNRNVYFQSIPFINQENRNLSHMNNYRDFVFQVWPGLSFQAYKELMKAEKEKNMIKAGLQNSANDPNLQEYYFFLFSCIYFNTKIL